MKLTRNLAQIVDDYKTKLPQKEYESLMRHIQSLITHHYNDLSKYPPGMERAKRVISLVEEEISKSSQIATTCSKGCSACCHLEVQVTSDEAQILAEVVSQGIVDIDFERLKSLSQREKHDKLWARGVHPENRCLFLGEDGACKIYEYRPSACRKYSVTSDPEECERVDGNIMPRHIPQAEIVLSVAINLKDLNYGLMAKMLLEALNKKYLEPDKSAPLSTEI